MGSRRRRSRPPPQNCIRFDLWSALVCGALPTPPPPTKPAIVDFMIDEEERQAICPSTLPVGNVKSAGISIFDTVFQLTKQIRFKKC